MEQLAKAQQRLVSSVLRLSAFLNLVAAHIIYVPVCYTVPLVFCLALALPAQSSSKVSAVKTPNVAAKRLQSVLAKVRASAKLTFGKEAQLTRITKNVSTEVVRKPGKWNAFKKALKFTLVRHGCRSDAQFNMNVEAFALGSKMRSEKIN
ncbi:unnamed protein product [Phytophthora lilii]|uniref:Unnamed protein product n=1 Tax=Phytophthora lilii TaxID=2077276 RepID=A0A9W6U5W0_9STRA|nr:unnamed protein product [Phytophthora lilii]